MMMRKKGGLALQPGWRPAQRSMQVTIKGGIPVDQINYNYVSNLIVLQNRGREYTCLAQGNIFQ
jgi:hypothetical protein